MQSILYERILLCLNVTVPEGLPPIPAEWIYVGNETNGLARFAQSETKICGNRLYSVSWNGIKHDDNGSTPRSWCKESKFSSTDWHYIAPIGSDIGNALGYVDDEEEESNSTPKKIRRFANDKSFWEYYESNDEVLTWRRQGRPGTTKSYYTLERLLSDPDIKEINA